MNTTRILSALGLSLALAACSTAPTRPAAWAAPEVLVATSSFGVHGLAVDAQGRLLAGTVVGNDMWRVDRTSGQASVFIAAPEGQSDDIAIGPKGGLAWTSYLQGIVRYRESDAGSRAAWRRWTRPAGPSPSSTPSSRRPPRPTSTAGATCG